MFTLSQSHFLKRGVTPAEIQSSGSLPCLIDWLKISHTGIQMRSAHSRISLADTLTRPVALDLFRLFISERTLFALHFYGQSQWNKSIQWKGKNFDSRQCYFLVNKRLSKDTLRFEKRKNRHGLKCYILFLELRKGGRCRKENVFCVGIILTPTEEI